MRTVSLLLVALWLVLSISCATPPQGQRDASDVVQAERLAGNRVRLAFPPEAPVHGWEVLRPEEARAVLASFHLVLRRLPSPRFQQALASGTPAEWELPLRREFLARYGPALLPLPGSLEHSRLVQALRMSPRYMGPGIRDAAHELFSSPAFLASVALSVTLYLAAWALPEPVFSKGFAAALTVRLALAVGLLELRNLGLACYRLYQEAEAARTREELEAVAERFGRAMGGTALRALVLVASFGVGRTLPDVPKGGLWSLLTPPRYAMPGGMTVQGATSAQMVAEGTLVVTGVAAGTEVGSARGAGGACTDGAEKRDGYQWHHLATDKNDASDVRGGPWTPRFEDLFARAGMDLQGPANLVYLQGHEGPHPEEYHREVYRRLQDAVRGCQTVAQCRSSLVETLGEIAKDVCTPGSKLHAWTTKP